MANSSIHDNTPSANSMVGVNDYHRALSDVDIDAGVHRDFVGGLWEEIGSLQFDFLVAQGLKPSHTLIDIACGALRGGVHFVRYLEPSHYYGFDINASLLRAGQRELDAAGLADRNANLLIDDKFQLSRFGQVFDYGVSVSLFTHLYLNHIGRCLTQMRKVMHTSSQFFVTFFQASSPMHLEPITHTPGNAKTYYDSDPFHYAFDEIEGIAQRCGLSAALIGEWNHPRDQQMIRFRLKSANEKDATKT
jgi:cyclopropane fatty-acyl-phospholipid synthase-like methyltransferase